MRKKILLCGAAMAIIGGAFCLPQDAQAAQPTRDYVAITNASSQTFTVPLYQNGSLLRLDLHRFTPATAAVTVKQIQTVGSLTVTNPVAVVTAVNGTNTAVITGVYPLPGDVLLFSPDAAATGTVSFVRQVGN